MKESLKEFLFLFLEGGVTREEQERIRNRINAYNQVALRRYSFWVILFLTVLSLLALKIDYMQTYLPAYAGGLGLAVVCWLLQRRSGANEKGLRAGMMLLLFILLEFGILTGTVYSPKEPAATYIALLVFTCLLFIQKPFRIFLLFAACDVQFIILGFHVKERAILSSDLLNAIAFTAVAAVFSSFITSDRLRRLVLEAELDRMSRTDQMTGLKNRYSYENRITELSGESIGSVSFIYIDVNGLHDLNNREGHEAGDRMLQCIAGQLCGIFGSEDTYRIGGDEFAVFVMNEAEEAIREKIRHFTGGIEKEGYSVAAGLACEIGENEDIMNLIKRAESGMYIDKEIYYRKTGHSHR